jgi:predicted nucleic acid-binding protein
LRVVLDTNVVLSALVFGGGAAGRLRLGVATGHFCAAGQHGHGARAGAGVGYPKFRFPRQSSNELLADYLPWVQTVRIPQPPPPVPECRDVLDEPFMHLAWRPGAQVLVSGDRDLLAIAAEFERASGCPILAMDTLFKHPLTTGLLSNR